MSFVLVFRKIIIVSEHIIQQQTELRDPKHFVERCDQSQSEKWYVWLKGLWRDKNLLISIMIIYSPCTL